MIITYDCYYTLQLLQIQPYMLHHFSFWRWGFTIIDATFVCYFCQPGLRSIWEKYYEEAHAVVYVIDATCPSRFEDSKSALGR